MKSLNGLVFASVKVVRSHLSQFMGRGIVKLYRPFSGMNHMHFRKDSTQFDHFNSDLVVIKVPIDYHILPKVGKELSILIETRPPLEEVPPFIWCLTRHVTSSSAFI